MVRDLVVIPTDRIFYLKINFEIKSRTPRLVAKVYSVSLAFIHIILIHYSFIHIIIIYIYSYYYKSANCVDYRPIFKVSQMFGFGISTVDKAAVLPLGFQVYIYK